MKDKLDILFELQAELNKKIGSNLDSNSSDEEKSKWILNYTRAMTQELAELNDSVPWKWWAKYQKFDKQNIAVELVDILHFWISACQVMDLSPDDVYRIYTKKHEVNLQRQNSGYKDKNSEDCKHID